MFALDISENRIRVLEIVKKHDHFLLHGMAEGPLAHVDDLPAVLQKLTKEAKPKPILTEELAFAIPEEETFIKVVNIPKDEPEMLQAKLLENISGVLPYAPEEIYWDWRIVGDGKDQEDHVDAVFVAATKKIVDRYIDLITQGGFRPLLVETEVNALLWGALNPLFTPADIEPTILVDFGLSKTTMIIFVKGAIRFTTSTKIVLGDIPRAPGVSPEHMQNPKYLDDLSAQIKECIDYYQEHLMHTHGGAAPTPITQLLLTGAWSEIGDISASFGKKLNLTIREQPKILPLTPSYITALGLSLRAIYEET